MRSHFFAAFFLALILTGCGLHNLSYDYKLDPEGETGILVFSLSRSGINGISITAGIRGVGHSYKSSIILPDRGGDIDWKEDCTFLRNPMFHQDLCYAKLSVIRLPEGYYEFYTFFGEGSTPLTAVYITLNMKPRRLSSFSVERGRVVYAGNLHFGFTLNAKTGKIFYGIEGVDREERDMALFHQRYKNIDPEMVTTGLKF